MLGITRANTSSSISCLPSGDRSRKPAAGQLRFTSKDNKEEHVLGGLHGPQVEEFLTFSLVGSLRFKGYSRKLST
ncbi:unnamed protein product [Victoria cruziana]